MKTLTEDYVSYEIAVLLKEKGFPQQEYINTFPYYTQNGNLYFGDINTVRQRYYDKAIAITQSIALKWLREVHGKNIIIEIASDTDCSYRLWSFNVWDSNYAILWGKQKPKFEKYEQAIEAALKYTLENLI